MLPSKLGADNEGWGLKTFSGTAEQGKVVSSIGFLKESKFPSGQYDLRSVLAVIPPEGQELGKKIRRLFG